MSVERKIDSRGSSGRRGAPSLVAMLGLLGLLASPIRAQSLNARVAAVQDGRVRMSFAARPGVCGNGRNISVHRSNRDWESDCAHGPVRVVLTRRDGKVVEVDTYVGGHWRAASDARDLGTVSAPDAANYLVSLRMKGAVFPATLADSVTIWPRLLDVARDASVRSSVRRDAVFWLGQAAGEAATKDLVALADSSDRDVQEAAVFALSQLHDGAGVPDLIEIARTHPDPEVRRKAMFWLGQSHDPRALALFEEILAGKGNR
ncbi:MAG: HEAT repeat domain-containing protein [Candidatus Palauibacterales bacterium]|nr:HEAT repeat domain-containing protein [Candidatus Palauibacterales bacterium]MDP2529799.1 HEAT repeat domain-containing protein [Candidatus Palauibacterales bacterium]MDP2582691.1 HEAT repeat domain-containing protein [Candidatus Palauibacterales bacterium]